MQVLNAIFRPVGKISSPFLGDRVPAGVQEEEVFNNVPEEHQIKNEPLYVFTKVNDRSDRDLRIRDIVDSNNLED